MPEPAYLLDTNILLRIANRGGSDHTLVYDAVARLADSGAILYYTPQNIAEFWNVATRPAAKNGFGLGPSDVDAEIRLFEQGMVLLPDREAIYLEWRRLVLNHKVSGVQVHDARLVAAMIVYGVPNLLTLNTGDFGRFPQIQAVHPSTVL